MTITAADSSTWTLGDLRMPRLGLGAGLSPARYRIAGAPARGPHVPAIAGTGDRWHLEQSVAAGAVRLG